MFLQREDESVNLQLDGNGDEDSHQAGFAGFIADSTFKLGRFHVIFVLAIRPITREFTG